MAPVDNTKTETAPETQAPAEAKRKQISVSLTPAEYEQFTELAFTLRQRKDSDVLRLAIVKLGAEHGVKF